MQRVLHILEDNGQEGLVTRFNRFETRWTTREADKITYDNRQAIKMNLILAAVLILVTAIGIWVGYRAANHQSILEPQSTILNAERLEINHDQIQ